MIFHFTEYFFLFIYLFIDRKGPQAYLKEQNNTFIFNPHRLLSA